MVELGAYVGESLVDVSVCLSVVRCLFYCNHFMYAVTTSQFVNYVLCLYLTALAGCLQLLEILEISWYLIGPPGNFCVRCRRSTALVSSHKNMDKYSLQKYEIYRHQMCFLSSSRCTKTVFGQAPPRTPVGELMTLL